MMGTPVTWDSRLPAETRPYYRTKGEIVDLPNGGKFVALDKGAQFETLSWKDLTRAQRRAVLAQDAKVRKLVVAASRKHQK